jgi:hypothetical protein
MDLTPNTEVTILRDFFHGFTLANIWPLIESSHSCSRPNPPLFVIYNHSSILHYKISEGDKA